MKMDHEETKALRLEFCERCAIVENPAVILGECARDRMIQSMVRFGFRTA